MDLPGALVTRWLAWIRLFDFEVRHVKGTKHSAADGLSRRPQFKDDFKDELDIDGFVVLELDIVGISVINDNSKRRNKVYNVSASRGYKVPYNHVI